MTKNCPHKTVDPPLANIYLSIKKNLIKNVIKKVPECLAKCRWVGVK